MPGWDETPTELISLESVGDHPGEGLYAEPLRPGIGGDGAQQEDGFNANEAFIQRTGHGQVPAHDVHLTREASRVWVACQRANSGARADQLGHDLSTDIAGCSGNQNQIFFVPHLFSFSLPEAALFERALAARS